MARTCTVCTHPERPAIDRALVEGVPYRIIAKRFDASPAAVNRHKDHVPATLAKAKAAAEIADADTLLDEPHRLRRRALGILDKAEASGDLRTALAGVREARACVETLMEVEGELDRRGVVNIHISPEWVRIQTVMLTTLEPFPEARQSVADALAMIEGDTGHVSA